MTDVDRVILNTIPLTESGCWVWLGYVTEKGYPMGYIDGKNVRVHRWLYQKLFGNVGELTIDHKCKVRSCVNPSHLEAVTRGENSLRGDGPTAINKRKLLCHKGHEFDSTVKRSSGAVVRRCSICHNQRTRDCRIKKAADRAKRGNK